MAFDFPSSPAEGQVFNAPSGPSYVFNSPLWRAVGQGQIAIIADAPPSNPANGTLWLESDTGLLFAYWNDGNSSQWVQVGGNAASGAIVTTVWTVSGTYTKPAGLRYLQVEAVAAGGSSGGPTTTTLSTQACVSGGGGAGAYGKRLFAASELGATETITIGVGGAAGAAGSNGSGGGATVFGTTFNCALAGGLASARSTVVTTHTRADGGVGGAAGAGWTIGVTGATGDASYAFYNGATNLGLRGNGGMTVWSTTTGIHFITTGIQGGFTHSGYGAGARGAMIQSAVNAAIVGGDGSPGLMILTEYF